MCVCDDKWWFRLKKKKKKQPHVSPPDVLLKLTAVWSCSRTQQPVSVGLEPTVFQRLRHYPLWPHKTGTHFMLWQTRRYTLVSHNNFQAFRLIPNGHTHHSHNRGSVSQLKERGQMKAMVSAINDPSWLIWQETLKTMLQFLQWASHESEMSQMSILGPLRPKSHIPIMTRHDA